MLLAAMTEDEVQRSVRHEGNGTAVEQLLNELVESKRVARLRVGKRRFGTGAERLLMLQTIYPDAGADSQVTVPESAQRQNWDRSAVIRELLGGRIEVSGPMSVGQLENILGLARSEIETALLGLESEGFVLRGKFHPNTTEQEWCDRRLPARIHRLTIDRLRAEIKPVSLQDFYRFLFVWQRAGLEHPLAAAQGLESVLDQLDGCELPLAACQTAS